MPLATKTFTRASMALLLASGLVLLAILATSLTLVANTRTRTNEVARAQDVRLHAYRLLGLLQDAETGQRGYLLTNEPAYLGPYRVAKAGMDGELAQLKALLDSPDRATITPLSTLIDAKMVELGTTIELAQTGHKDQALAVVDSNAGRNLMDQVRDRVNDLINNSNGEVQTRLDALRAGAVTLQVVTVVGAFLIVGFLIGSLFLVQRYTSDLNRAMAELDSLNAELEERVRARTAELTRANDEIQRFAYIVSHDLRAPLVNVMGFTSEMEEGLAALRAYFDGESGADASHLEAARFAATKDLPESIGFIRSSTGKMDMLINAILKLSREGGRVLTPEPIDLKPLVERAGAAVRHQLAERGGDFEVEGELPALTCDRLAVEQVFGNLIDNAVKYLALDRPGKVVVRGRNEGSRAVVEVEDNGRGIAAGDHERIFELFRRSGVQDRAGEGIGLAHVRALVRRLGGEITVKSELGKGSLFRVVLPRNFSAAAPGGRA